MPAHNLPLVSCLCVTRGRIDLLKHAVHCFMRQTYLNRELVIVYEHDDTETWESLTQDLRWDALGDARILMMGHPAGASLGELRNAAVKAARGEYICQWDDDDSYAPERLSTQMRYVLENGRDFVVLARWLMWDGAMQRVVVSGPRMWEGSLLCRKDKMPLYPDLRRGEDTAVIETLVRSGASYEVLDLPELYVYTYQGKNTWNYLHFAKLCANGTAPSPAQDEHARRLLPAPLPRAEYPQERRTLSLLMMCREKDAAAAQEKVRGYMAHRFVDEAVLLVTGEGSEPTRDLDTQGVEGIKSPYFQWCDDFAAARNYALDFCTQDYVLWLDDDDEVPEDSWQLIRATLDKPGPLTAMRACHFGFQIDNMDAGGNVIQSFQQARMFPRLGGIRWEGRIHETYSQSIAEQDLIFVPTNIKIRHLGYADPAVVREKQERNLKILFREGEQVPDDDLSPISCYHIACSYLSLSSVESDPREAAQLAELADAILYVVRVHPDTTKTPGLRDTVRHMQALLAIQRGEWHKVPDLIEGSRKVDSVYLAAKYCQWKGDTAMAITHYERYISFGPDIQDPLGTNVATFRVDAEAQLRALKGGT